MNIDMPPEAAERIIEALESAGLTTDARIGAVGGPSTTTMSKIRSAQLGAQGVRVRSDTLTAIDQAMDWLPGSTRRLIQTGVMPKRQLEIPAAAPEVTPTRLEALEARLAVAEERLATAEALLRQAKATSRSMLAVAAHDGEDDQAPGAAEAD